VTDAVDALDVARVGTVVAVPVESVVVSLVLDVTAVLVGGVDDADVGSVSGRVVLVNSVPVEPEVAVALDIGGSLDCFCCRAESGLMGAAGSPPGTCERVAVLAGSRVTRRTRRHRVAVIMTAAHSLFIALPDRRSRLFTARGDP
jgi:hypothetical protein